MSDSPEKRDFLRVLIERPVRYRFVRRAAAGPERLEECDGSSVNLSGGGLLLSGPIPDVDWVVDLLMEKIVVMVEIDLGLGERVKALTRVAWLEELDEETHVCKMGLKFKEITRQAQDQILNFIIESQLP